MTKRSLHNLICATSNQHKIDEMRAILPVQYSLQGLKDIGYEKEIPEEQETLTGNAIQKAETLYSELGVDCFAEDTGLEIDALDGAPGVYSARYAGSERSSEANMAKVLGELADQENRNAQFRTVIALIWEGETHTFEGIFRGEILKSPEGEGGFGYDPIFRPEGYENSFGLLPKEVKQKISHRSRAVGKLMAFLEMKIS